MGVHDSKLFQVLHHCNNFTLKILITSPRLNTVQQTTIPLGSVRLYYMMYEYPNHIGFIVSLFNSKHYHFGTTAAPFLFYSIRNFSPKILGIFIISKSFYTTTLTVLTRAQYSREIPETPYLFARIGRRRDQEKLKKDYLT